MTRQQYLDLLLKTSAEGRFPGYARGSCRYMDGQGRKCAVGILLPENHPATSHKGDVFDMTEDNPDVLELFPEGLGLTAMRIVQRAHDAVAANLRGDWDHNLFVWFLHDTRLFEDLNF